MDTQKRKALEMAQLNPKSEWKSLEICWECGGTGYIIGGVFVDDEFTERCSACGGSGVRPGER